MTRIFLIILRPNSRELYRVFQHPLTVSHSYVIERTFYGRSQSRCVAKAVSLMEYYCRSHVIRALLSAFLRTKRCRVGTGRRNQRILGARRKLAGICKVPQRAEIGESASGQ